ncbi:Low molecular weight protein-tyrosine-phosphatase YfkJ [Lactococcus lactis]|uniref:low molecular weight protein-tyrosine-phosphatase n=1 Tax=Lactococcus lactis TaxID=1358 RepID=UPI00384A95EF
MEKIVFVCLGNICRSPMAEFVMKDLVEKAGNESKFLIESRATSSWEHGNPIHSGTQTKLKEQKITFDLQKGSQKISSEDFYEFDKIIAMDESNLENLRKMAPEGTSQKIVMLLEQGVPDPWFTGDFQETYQLVKTGCQRLLDEIV